MAINSMAAKNRPAEDHALTAVAIACSAFAFLVLSYPLLRGNIYHASDLGGYHLPARAFYSYCLQNGFNPFWWPGAYCGYYLLGEGQVGMLHPLRWLAYRFLSLQWAFNVEFVSGYLFIFSGVTALLRRWQQPWYASLFGATCFTFSGFTLLHFMHLQAITIVGHLPWVILTVDALLTANARVVLRRSWLTLVLLIASALLLGYPQYVLFILLGLALYCTAHLSVPGAPKRFFWIAGGLVAGFLIGAAQLLPTMDLLRSVQRSHAADFWQSGSMHPLNLLQLAGPYFFENRVAYGAPAPEYCLYTGVLPLLLGLFGAITAYRFPSNHRLFRLFLVQVVLALVLALGMYGGLYGLVAKLPLLGSFRCPARHIVLIHFALSVMAALALPRLILLAADPGVGRVARRLLAATTAFAVSALATAWAIRGLASEEVSQAFTGSSVFMVLSPLLLVVGAGTIALALRWPRCGVACILLLSTVDIGLYAVPQVWRAMPQPTPLSQLLTAMENELPDDPTFTQHNTAYRALGNWRTARLSMLGLPQLFGYVGLPPSWTLDPNSETTKRLAGVRWEKVPIYARDWTIREDALPRARLVAHAITASNPRDTVETIDIAHTALIEIPLELPEGESGNVTWVQNHPGDVVLQTDSNSTQILVFAERYNAGWSVSVNGEPDRLLRVYGEFMGCVVPAGTHRVQFRFTPPSVRYGLVVSGVGIFLAVGIFSATAQWQRRGCNENPC